MKQIIFLFSCFFIVGGSLFAQIGDKMNFQMIVRASDGELLSNASIGLRFRIIQDNELGTVVFEETHNTTTNSIGIVTVKIGHGSAVIGTIEEIDWTTGLYYISTEVDALGGNVYALQQTSALHSVPFAASASKTMKAETLDYRFLTNKPVTITGAQSTAIDLIDVTNAINLEDTKIATDLNTLKAFPGFGTTAGTAFEVLWTKIENDAFFITGTVGMGTNLNLDTSAASLVVESGIHFLPNTATTSEIGTLDYYNLEPSQNDFYYGDNDGNIKRYAGINDIVFDKETLIHGNLGIGDAIVASYNFNDNDLVLASATPSIFFEDTSGAASFPSVDWSIRINDLEAGGDNYFNIINEDLGFSNFKIMAGAPSHSFTLQKNGNVGVKTAIPEEALEVSNAVVAASFIGDFSNLTNLPAGSSSTTNTGSTTIGVDTNSDTVGALIFKTQNQTKMSLQSNGAIAIGALTPTSTLEVDGNTKMEGLVTNTLSVTGSLSTQISIETPPSVNTINLLDKSVIIFNGTASKSYYIFTNITEGQVFTIINSGTGTLYFGINQRIISLEQNESFTGVSKNNGLIVDGSHIIVTALVN